MQEHIKDLKLFEKVIDNYLHQPGEDEIRKSLSVLNAKIDRSQRRNRIRRIAIAASLSSLAAAVCLFVFLSYHSHGAKEFIYSNASAVAMNFVLPDSTNITLAPGAELRFSQSFNVKDRNVYLSGESFFDVTRNEELPFVVSTDDFRVKVLGTVFNVRNGVNGDSEVVLASGSVQIQNAKGLDMVKLHPGQQALFDKESNSLEIHEIPVGDMLSQHYGIISLHGVTVSEILNYLENIYKVRINTTDIMDRTLYNFSFQSQKSIDDVLEMLGFVCKHQKFKLVGD